MPIIQRDFVVLVDEHGCDLLNTYGQLSTMEKMEVHRRGLLHRAVSVFVFNHREELLLQKRAASKYHSPQKWSNTCCTHPSPGEIPVAAAQRRLGEEMGLSIQLTEVFTFSYQVGVGNGLIENEFDHVFFGFSKQNPKPNSDEVSDWKWIAMEDLKEQLTRNPEEYSPWLRQCFGKVIKHKS
ncbi:MAG: isopentenyl-diphosphate Delta-isomerase [Dehalococcoidales bacterium]|nr:isopentenyl-diphosphate Delta-isomerase [Dehalococcoidales bacterium]